MLDDEPISGAVRPLNFGGGQVDNGGGSMNPPYVYTGSSQPAALLEWPTFDSGGNVGIRTSLRFSSYGGMAIVNKAWLRCVPF